MINIRAYFPGMAKKSKQLSNDNKLQSFEDGVIKSIGATAKTLECLLESLKNFERLLELQNDRISLLEHRIEELDNDA